MAPTLKPSTNDALRTYISAATTGSNLSLPGVILQILDASGNVVFAHATPNHTPHTFISIFSCSKIIGAIAFLQLVDRGLATLDDPSIIEKWLPELASKKVLVGSKVGDDGEKEWVFEDRKGNITPRMLMNHTNGTGNSFFNTELRDFLGDNSTVNEGTEYFETLAKSPLLWQPGAKTNYGHGFDWLSALIERLTGQSLEDVLREGLFDKLGIEKAGFRGELGGRVVAGEGLDFWPVNYRTEDGYGIIPGIAEKKVVHEDAWPKGKRHVQSVAAGLGASVVDLAQIFSILLPQNAGVDPLSGTRILSAASAAEVAKLQHPEQIRNNSRNFLSANPLVVPYDLQAVDPAGYFGLGGAVQGEDRVLGDGRRGRSKGTVYWYGAAGTTYWIDGEKGLVVVVACNFFPFMDAKCVEFVEEIEGLLYEGIEE